MTAIPLGDTEGRGAYMHICVRSALSVCTSLASHLQPCGREIYSNKILLPIKPGMRFLEWTIPACLRACIISTMVLQCLIDPPHENANKVSHACWVGSNKLPNERLQMAVPQPIIRLP